MSSIYKPGQTWFVGHVVVKHEGGRWGHSTRTKVLGPFSTEPQAAEAVASYVPPKGAAQDRRVAKVVARGELGIFLEERCDWWYVAEVKAA